MQQLISLSLGLFLPLTAVVAFSPPLTPAAIAKTGFSRGPTATAHTTTSRPFSFALAAAGAATAPAKSVWILPTEEQVTKAVHQIVEEAASRAIAERGHFALAIPGGSVLKVLSSLEAGDWVSKTTLAYVNHKCVPNDDLNSAIHAKVRAVGTMSSLFVNVFCENFLQ